MGSKYSWDIFGYKIEYTPFVYVRAMKQQEDQCWKVTFEHWW